MFTRKCVRGSNPLLSATRIYLSLYAHQNKKKVKPSSRHWIQRQLSDQYVALAQKQGYRSRAAYKILQIHEKFHIFKKGYTSLDLGAAPGGWSQVAANLTGSNAQNNLVVAVDLFPIESINGVKSICGSFLDKMVQQEILQAFLDSTLGNKCDVVMSDMAPNTIGQRTTDYIRIMNLCEEAFCFAEKILNPGGSFIVKVFRGGADNQILTKIKNSFFKVKHFKPPASRQESTEMYLIAQGFKQGFKNNPENFE